MGFAVAHPIITALIAGSTAASASAAVSAQKQKMPALPSTPPVSAEQVQEEGTEKAQEALKKKRLSLLAQGKTVATSSSGAILGSGDVAKKTLLGA